MCAVEAVLGFIAFMCFGAAACGAGIVTLSIGIGASVALVGCFVFGFLFGGE